MGQSLSRRHPAPTPVPALAHAPEPGCSDDAHIPHRSLPLRILSSIPKPSLRSRLFSSLTLPTRPEQTLRGKNRRWRFSRRHAVPSNTDELVSERMGPLTEHDEHQVDRDVDEFGVITHRVLENHNDTSVTSPKGKEKATDVSGGEDDVEDDDDDKLPIPSTSTAPSPAQSGAGNDHVGDDEVVITPTVIPSPSRHPSPLPLSQVLERSSVPLPSALTPTPPSQPLSQQANTSPRPFPPPGTLVVVQGVVHTTDVPRPSDRPPATSNPVPATTNDAPYANINNNFDHGSVRPSSVPPETRPRNPLSGILPRPTSMTPAVPSPLEPIIGFPNTDAQTRQTLSNVSGATDDGDDEDRVHTHPHGFSMAQGPVGASGLSASSIDVLGTLLSVAAAATAASLLTGSSEPIFSSGLTSQPTPSSNPVPQPTFSSNVPSERPLSPTPTSDAGRMRHVWSSLRDRLGLGSGAQNSSHPGDTTSGLGQIAQSQASDIARPRDPREIMLAEMARAFNLGLGLGGATTSIPPTTNSENSNPAELAIPDNGDVTGNRDAEQSSLPPPDSFERFLMDLQTDLRVTLMQDQGPGTLEVPPRNVDATEGDVDGDQLIPELQSLSDSDSEEFGTGQFESDDEDDFENDTDNEDDEEDLHTAQEQPSGRTSPAVSAFGIGSHYPFGVRTSSGSSFLGSTGASPSRVAATSSISTAISPGADEIDVNSSSRDIDVGRIFSSASVGTRTCVLADSLSQSETRSEEPGEWRRGVVSGVAHSQDASNRGRRAEAEGCHAASGSIAVPPLPSQCPSNVPGTGPEQAPFLLGTSTSGHSTSNIGNSAVASRIPTQPSNSTLPPLSDPEPTTQTSSINPDSGDSTMPFRLPFTSSSASRTEHTPGGGINWWRMYRFPAIASPNPGQQGGTQGSSLSQPTFRTPAQGPSLTSTSPWARTTDQDQQNETVTPRGWAPVPDVRGGLTPPGAVSSTNMPETVSSPNQSTTAPPSTNGQDSNPLTNAGDHPPEHRSNVVVPVIVVGLQSVNMDRQPPHIAHPHANHNPAIGDEEGEGLEFDGLEHPMSMPLHIPEPAEFLHPSPPTTNQQEQSSSQSTRGRTWQSRAANAIRNLRPSRRNADATSPQPQEAPGSRTFLIYVIGGYYPPDHQIITGGNLDSFEALWELAELLGQVKPPTASKEEIEKSGLEVIKASMLKEYEKQGRVAGNCIDKCLICLDDYDAEDELRVLTCKHTFHQACVDRWLETGRNNCPACRTKGVSNESASPPSPTPGIV